MTTTTSPRTAPPFFASYGMGAESTAWLHRILTYPDTRPSTVLPDYSNLIVATAQTGDEWSVTGELVEEHILPLLRAKRIRFVEVARKGPTKADGVAVLQDSRTPHKLHLGGIYKLSQENRESGTMPILSGHHTCAQKSKGEPLDWWRATEFGNEPYYHMIGYNVLETSRMEKDAGYSMGGQRTAVYPVHDWQMSRDDCVSYLLDELDVVWPKSCCRQCPYINLAGWNDQLAMFETYAAEAVPHLIDEYVTLALNPRSGLYGPGKSLIGRLKRDQATNVLNRAAQRINTMRWALYLVRRRYNAPAIAPRSVQKLFIGNRWYVQSALAEVAHYSSLPLYTGEHIKGAPKKKGDFDMHSRLWVKRRKERRYPSLEEFLVAAPAQANDKALSTFNSNWTAISSPQLIQVERQLHAAIDTVADLRGDARRREIARVLQA